MSGELVPELRVVRCPKCRLLLQEPTGCDLYKCGECGTTLQGEVLFFAFQSFLWLFFLDYLMYVVLFMLTL